MPLEADWHSSTTSASSATALSYTGQVKRAETLLKSSFALPTNLLVQAYNKREWPMFLRARGRYAEAEAAARTLMADPNPVVQATGHIEAGHAMLAQNRWADARERRQRGAASCCAPRPAVESPRRRCSPCRASSTCAPPIAPKGRATLEEAVRRMRAAPGPDAWAQALFQIEAIARAARTVGDWELAGQMAEADDRPRPVVRWLALRARAGRRARR